MHMSSRSFTFRLENRLGYWPQRYAKGSQKVGRTTHEGHPTKRQFAQRSASSFRVNRWSPCEKLPKAKSLLNLTGHSHVHPETSGKTLSRISRRGTDNPEKSAMKDLEKGIREEIERIKIYQSSYESRFKSSRMICPESLEP